jgi:hypothetical protein
MRSLWGSEVIGRVLGAPGLLRIARMLLEIVCIQTGLLTLAIGVWLLGTDKAQYGIPLLALSLLALGCGYLMLYADRLSAQDDGLVAEIADGERCIAQGDVVDMAEFRRIVDQLHE